MKFQKDKINILQQFLFLNVFISNFNEYKDLLKY